MKEFYKKPIFWIVVAIIIIGIYGYNKGWFSKKMGYGGMLSPEMMINPETGRSGSFPIHQPIVTVSRGFMTGSNGAPYCRNGAYNSLTNEICVDRQWKAIN